MDTLLSLNLTSLMPVGFLYIGLKVWRKWDDLVNGRKPVQEKLLRAPGESLQRRIEAIDDRILMPIIVLAGLTALIQVSSEPGSKQSLEVWVATAIASLLLVGWIVCLGRERRELALEWSGERAVGEELNKLMIDGYHVFHDLPAGEEWNIHHVVVGPSGVYAVETKCRQKRRTTDGKATPEVVFDGRALRYPNHDDADSVRQAKRNARWLEEHLSKTVGEPVTVVPVLALPGWFVTDRSGNELKVVNPKQARSLVVEEPAQLSPAAIKRISHQLAAKCRGIEF